MNHYLVKHRFALLHMLYALSLVLEYTYIAAVHTYTLGYVLGTYLKRIDYKDAALVLRQHIETINQQFVYAY